MTCLRASAVVVMALSFVRNCSSSSLACGAVDLVVVAVLEGVGEFVQEVEDGDDLLVGEP
jgi:hypothetical protein